MSERKAFKFYHSYYEVLNELNDKDKLSFINALLHRQFTGVEPTNLKGMAKFAYISQKHSIDSQVEGYINKKGEFKHDSKGVTQGGVQGGNKGVTLEEKEKEKEEEQYVKSKEEKFIDWFNIEIKKYKGKNGRFSVSDKITKNLSKIRKHNYDINDYTKVLYNLCQAKNHVEDNFQYITPELMTREVIFQRELNNNPSKAKKRIQDQGKGTGGKGLYEE